MGNKIVQTPIKLEAEVAWKEWICLLKIILSTQRVKYEKIAEDLKTLNDNLFI